MRDAVMRGMWDVRETDFQVAIIDLAQLAAWLVYHTHDARRSAPGWPDLALCKPPRLLLVELKTRAGRVRPEQREWLAALAQCPGIEVALWRPIDWPATRGCWLMAKRSLP